MQALTPGQSRVFNFIRAYLRRNGYPPTLQEIGTAMGMRSKAHVDHYLKMLAEKGYIQRVPRRSRGIKLLNERGNTFGVPFLGQIAAGQPLSFGDDTYEMLELTRDIVKEQEGLYALRVRGDSMIDALVHDGDVVVLKHQLQASNGEMVAVRLRDENETTLKRFYLENGRVRLQPANPTMEPIYAHPANVEIQGRVMAVIRQLS